MPLCHGGFDAALLAYTAVFQPGGQATESRPGMAVVDVRTSYQPSPRAMEQPGTPPLVRTTVEAQSLAAIERDVELAAGIASCVVVSFHWGISGNREPVDYQVDLAHRAVDAGASIVFGHHPHALSPMGLYRGRPVLYSLANLVFESGRPVSGMSRETTVAVCHVTGARVTAVDVVAFVREPGGHVRRADGDDAVRICDSVVPPGHLDASAAKVLRDDDGLRIHAARDGDDPLRI